MDAITKAKYEVWMWRRIFKRVVVPVFLFLIIFSSVSFVFALRSHGIANRSRMDDDLGIVLEEELDDYEDEVYEEEWPERVVFLTFDDGPSQNTARILDILAYENAPSIFFLLGSSITNQSNSAVLMERILRDGHYIGLHSMTHSNQLLYVGYDAPARFVDEMVQLQNMIYEQTAHRTNLCRAPYGMMSGFRSDSGHAEAIFEAGIKCIDWNVDPEDWRSSSDVIIQRVVDQVEMLNFPSELVIVLHERESTIEALPTVISYLREQGYVFKTYIPGHEFIYQRYNNGY